MPPDYPRPPVCTCPRQALWLFTRPAPSTLSLFKKTPFLCALIHIWHPVFSHIPLPRGLHWFNLRATSQPQYSSRVPNARVTSSSKSSVIECRCLCAIERRRHNVLMYYPTLSLTRQVLGEQTVSPFFFSAFDKNRGLYQECPEWFNTNILQASRVVAGMFPIAYVNSRTTHTSASSVWWRGKLHNST